MGSGSGATRAVAQLVLLDDSFAVAARGRRRGPPGHRQRRAGGQPVPHEDRSTRCCWRSPSASLSLPFPFLPRHLTIVSQPHHRHPGLLPGPRAQRPTQAAPASWAGARFAVPAGAVRGRRAPSPATPLAGDQEKVSLGEARTIAVIVLFLVALWVLAILARPFNEWKAVLVASMGAAFVVVLATPAIREFFELDLPSTVLLSRPSASPPSPSAPRARLAARPAGNVAVTRARGTDPVAR